MMKPVAAPQRRRDTRYPIQMPVVLRSGSRRQEVLTEDVSFRGLFVRTDSPPALRELIQVSAELPPSGTPFCSHGMSVYLVEPDNAQGRAPGVGIQFYAMGSEQPKWDAFINYVKENADEIAAPEDAVDPIRRRHPRYPIALPVRPRDLEELLTLYSRDVSKGGMFLETDRDFEVGAELRLDVEHPDTREVFPLDAVVRRRSADPVGVGVEFTGMDDARRNEFFAFVHSAIPDLGADIELVAEEDPNLE